MIILLTGAGVSAPSGLETFRDTRDTGWWKQYDPNIVCHRAYRTTPQHYEFFNLYRRKVASTVPNDAHKWIAQLQRQHGDLVKLYTTNIDDLHTAAGSKQVCHLHGCVNQLRCDTCGHKRFVGLHATLNDDNELCPVGCSARGRMRNDVVLYDEPLPKEYKELSLDLQIATTKDVFVVLGSSLEVGEWHLKRTNAKRIFVNTDAELCAQMRPIFDEVYEEDCSNSELIEKLTITHMCYLLILRINKEKTHVQ